MGEPHVFGLSFIAAGRLQDKKGPFWISVAGSVLFSLGWVLATSVYVGSGICILALGSLLLAKRPEVSSMAGVEVVKGVTSKA